MYLLLLWEVLPQLRASCNWPNTPQLWSGRVRIWTEVCLTLSDVSWRLSPAFFSFWNTGLDAEKEPGCVSLSWPRIRKCTSWRVPYHCQDTLSGAHEPSPLYIWLCAFNRSIHFVIAMFQALPWKLGTQCGNRHCPCPSWVQGLVGSRTWAITMCCARCPEGEVQGDWWGSHGRCLWPV